MLATAPAKKNADSSLCHNQSVWRDWPSPSISGLVPTPNLTFVGPWNRTVTSFRPSQESRLLLQCRVVVFSGTPRPDSDRPTPIWVEDRRRSSGLIFRESKKRRISYEKDSRGRVGVTPATCVRLDCLGTGRSPQKADRDHGLRLRHRARWRLPDLRSGHR